MCLLFSAQNFTLLSPNTNPTNSPTSNLSWFQTGLTQMADTVIGGSVGPGLSGGQVS